MTKRSFDDAFWGDDFVQELNTTSKCLFAYLWTNKYCNSAALYQITPKTISFDTGIPSEQLEPVFKSLEPKVKWYPKQNIVWVKNFVKRQPDSPQYKTAVAKCLLDFNNNGLVKEFIEYNKSIGVFIPYDYNKHTVSIPNPYNDSAMRKSDTVSKPYPYHTIIDKDIDVDKDKQLLGGYGGTVENNVFKIYEENIGILTPMIAEELKDAERNYPLKWFEEATKIALKNNVRKLKYIISILENWKVNGYKNDKQGIKDTSNGKEKYKRFNEK